MSSIKIPDLNLYRGKRTQRHNHFESIQKKGAFLLQKSKNKDLVHELKAQLYLDTYKNSLNHFVSPSKYKEKAQQYLRSTKHEETLLMRAMSFPKVKYHCPNCFDNQQKQRKCYCEIESRMPQAYRVRSNEGQTQLIKKYPRQQNQNIQNININNVSERLQERELNFRPALKGEQHRKDISDHTIFELSQSNETLGKDISNLSQQKDSRLRDRGDRLINNLQFISNLSKHQNELDNIDLDGGESKSISVDFNDLMEAKKQYISKSREILHSLDTILQKYPKKSQQ